MVGIADHELTIEYDTRLVLTGVAMARKLTPYPTEAEFEIRYGTGIDAVGELLELGAEHGVLEKSGAWYSANGERIGQGKDKAGAALRENPTLREELERKLREALSLPAVEVRPLES